MKKLTLFVVVLMIFLTQSLSAGTVNVTGKWDMTVQSPRGERTRAIEFVQEGESLKVISKDRNGNTIEAKGTVKGDQVQWTMIRDTRRGKMELTYKGTVKDETMKGEMATPRGSMTWSAKRKK